MNLNNDGDFITIHKNDGTTVQAELYSTLEIDKLGKYVLYKINNEIFGAKYASDADETFLSTDLTEEEQKALNEAYESMEVEK